jgi:hypothetical protein
MSRSRKKTPVAATTTAASDKAFKQMEHRRARRAVKALDLTESDPPEPKAFGDPWNSQKDGKIYFDADRHPDLMRK